MIRDNTRKSYLYPVFGVDLPEGYQALGIDVSHYQVDINWAEVSAMKIHDDSIHFVFIKSTEGTALEDDRCFENAAGAVEAGLLFGVYHFFRAELSASDQALFFASKCLELNDSLRPVLDVEIHPKTGKDRLVDSVYVFLENFEKDTGIRPMIYTNESFYTDYFVNSYPKNERY